MTKDDFLDGVKKAAGLDIGNRQKLIDDIRQFDSKLAELAETEHNATKSIVDYCKARSENK